MAETLAELQAQRDEWRELLSKLAKDKASHSTADRSFANWDPRTVQDVIADFDRRISALTSPQSGGVTYLRPRRGR